MTETRTETLVAAMRLLARDIHSDDGVANAAIAEAAERLSELEAENAKLREELDRYRHMVSPENAIDLCEFMGPPKPCPFCGSVALTQDGFEEYIVCGNCGASAPVGGWQFRHETAREALEE